LNRISHLCFSRPGLWSSYSYFLHRWHDRCTSPCSVFIEMGSGELFCEVWPWTTILLISASRVARITEVSYCTSSICNQRPCIKAVFMHSLQSNGFQNIPLYTFLVFPSEQLSLQVSHLSSRLVCVSCLLWNCFICKT
jgi:hypothetical protein